MGGSSFARMGRKWDLQRSGSAAGHGQGPVQDGAGGLLLGHEGQFLRTVRGDEGEHVGIHPEAGPATFRLFAQIMSTFFFSSLARLFSTMSRVSMEKPQMNWPGRRCSPR